MQVTYGTLNDAEPDPYRTPGVGRATEGRDFVPLLDSVVFLTNQSEANITLRVLDDQDPEREESVFVKLINVQLIKGEQERLSKIIPLTGILVEKKSLNIMISQPYYINLQIPLCYYFFQFSIHLLLVPRMTS